ncbi:MAG TPA: hypothetical protein VJZ27_06190, partial [Aggregatilineales bacterium]|nr:hypothetical protein [Aggregatilineales bacterium]
YLEDGKTQHIQEFWAEGARQGENWEFLKAIGVNRKTVIDVLNRYDMKVQDKTHYTGLPKYTEVYRSNLPPIT